MLTPSSLAATFVVSSPPILLLLGVGSSLALVRPAPPPPTTETRHALEDSIYDRDIKDKHQRREVRRARRQRRVLEQGLAQISSAEQDHADPVPEPGNFCPDLPEEEDFRQLGGLTVDKYVITTVVRKDYP